VIIGLREVMMMDEVMYLMIVVVFILFVIECKREAV